LAEEKPQPRPRRKPAAAESPPPPRSPRKAAPRATSRRPRAPRPAAAAVAAPPAARPAPSPAERDLAGGRSGVYELAWGTGLLNVGALVRKEFTAYFVSPVGYVIAALMVLIVSLLGFLPPISQGQPMAMNAVYD